ncbi:hypothetical protein EYF80_001286 [Liparis tanakae]|uniref:Uncharacterized protein n=1 Tax=Liparis tanakae TaxID=230148 RepID=A0A4Z2JFC8_9TELE|nr:hypothetical protein EYF80_001286 [Liparis tanakae]
MDDHSTISEQGTCSATAVLQQSVPLHSWSTAGGRSWLTMPAILSTLLPQMTVSVAPRLVTESRDQHYTPAPTPTPAPAKNQRTRPSLGHLCPRSSLPDPWRSVLVPAILLHPGPTAPHSSAILGSSPLAQYLLLQPGFPATEQTNTGRAP